MNKWRRADIYTPRSHPCTEIWGLILNDLSSGDKYMLLMGVIHYTIAKTTRMRTCSKTYENKKLIKLHAYWLLTHSHAIVINEPINTYTTWHAFSANKTCTSLLQSSILLLIVKWMVVICWTKEGTDREYLPCCCVHL